MDCTAIKDIRQGQKNLNVIFIVLEVTSSSRTKENREVRTFKVADPTACINVSIWDEPGKLLIPGDIIKLTKGYASIFRSCLILYSGKNGDIQRIGDFCLAFNEQLNMSEPIPVAMNNGTNNNNNGRPQNPNTNTGSTNDNTKKTNNSSKTSDKPSGGLSDGSKDAPNYSMHAREPFSGKFIFLIANENY